MASVVAAIHGLKEPQANDKHKNTSRRTPSDESESTAHTQQNQQAHTEAETTSAQRQEHAQIQLQRQNVKEAENTGYETIECQEKSLTE